MRADRPKWPYLYSRSHVRFVRDARNGLRMRIMIRQWMLQRHGGPFAGAGPLSSAVAAPQAPFWTVIPRFRRSSPFKHLDQKHLVCQKHHAFLTFPQDAAGRREVDESPLTRRGDGVQPSLSSRRVSRGGTHARPRPSGSEHAVGRPRSWERKKVD